MLALIDYGAGNLRSVRRALQLCAPALQVYVGAHPERVAAADRIVLPGVGHFASCMRGVQEREGLCEALEQAVLHRGVPFLGICVGMQLLASTGTEDGESNGLNWIAGRVERLSSQDVCIPHMGWNNISCETHAVFEGLAEKPHMYFAHSYVFRAQQQERIVAWCEHGERFAAALESGNIFAVQFHPEKSQKAGLRLFANFLEWKP